VCQFSGEMFKVAEADFLGVNNQLTANCPKTCECISNDVPIATVHCLTSSLNLR